MEHRIEFGGDPQDVTVTTAGPATVSEFRSLNEELVNHPCFHAPMKILVDHSELETGGLTASDIDVLAAHILQLDTQFGTSVVALVAPRAVVYGLGRMSETMIESLQGPRFQTFPTRDEAVAWLREQEAGD
ncbi:MAG: hypothetical protein ACXVRZ_03950 [Gaiellaceae bacterium]